ncbi:hypothetical protein TIFTF001_050454 [Ficus carica]|uniref:Uncharacterized protein n=1 Tax=Ficus carica TaxID=3494 RepID=A0AA87YZL5_FICCA|nr:hypothetical protein TIFTF001_050454 [Ficus carica]
MWSSSPVRAGQSLHHRSPVKGKHLGMIGTPMWCLPWALQCLNASRGPECSGRPGRVSYLGHPGGDSRVVVAGACRGSYCQSRWNVGSGYSSQSWIHYPGYDARSTI